MAAVVVRARFDSQTSDHSGRWNVKKGDFGVLKWKAHGRHPRFFEPVVLWDRDPQRQVRRVIVSSLTVVGLQTRGARVLLVRSVA